MRGPVVACRALAALVVICGVALLQAGHAEARDALDETLERLLDHVRTSGNDTAFARARELLTEAAEDPTKTEGMRQKAALALVELQVARAHGMAGRVDVPWAKLLAQVDLAARAAAEHAATSGSRAAVERAALLAGQVREDAAGWVRDSLLTDGAAMAARKVSIETAQRDAQRLVRDARSHYEEVLKANKDRAESALARTVRFRVVRCQYVAASLETPGSDAARGALVEVTKTLEGFVREMRVTGQRHFKLQGQLFLGLAWWERARNARDKELVLRAWRSAFGWFKRATEFEGDADDLAVISAAYGHLGEVAVEARSADSGALLKKAAEWYGGMGKRQATLLGAHAGMRPLIAWGRVARALGHKDLAIRVLQRAITLAGRYGDEHSARLARALLSKTSVPPQKGD